MSHRTQTGRLTATLGVGIVAATAAVISFSHVQDLARTAGEPELTAWLLPLSIDGAIAAAAAVILADSKAHRRPTALTWIMLTLGLAASLAANIASAHPTWTARAVAAWPPIALALGIEVLASMSRRARSDRDMAGDELPVVDMAVDLEIIDETAETSASASTESHRQDAASEVLLPPPVAASPEEPLDDPLGEPAPLEPAQPELSDPGPDQLVDASVREDRVDQLHLVGDPQPRPVAERPVEVHGDDEAVAVIRRLDEQAVDGQASRRTIQEALKCGASRATRLAALARTADPPAHQEAIPTRQPA